jgi:spore coat protein CotH
MGHLKNITTKVVSFVFILAITIACEKKLIPENGTPVIVSPGIVIKNIIPKGNEKYLKSSSEVIYNQEKVNTYNIIIKNESLYFLDNNPAKEEYVEASLVFEGDTISPIGIRYKGSIGAYAGCLSGPDWGNPSGYKTCPKLSMQLKLNWNDRKEKFYGLNKFIHKTMTSHN